MTIKCAYIYSDEFAKAVYSDSHPMRPMRLKLTYELTKELGLLCGDNISQIEARRATEDEILKFHCQSYIDILKSADDGVAPDNAISFGIGMGDCPAFKGVYTWSSFSAGASLQCAEKIIDGYDRAINICGGLHHAMDARASGFCYINDAVLCILKLIEAGKRVLYVDIDAHHGDGVEKAFYHSDQVLTFSIHESGNYIFPGTGFSKDFGSGRGKGYAVNLPVPPSAGDDSFVQGFREIFPLLVEKFKPDVLVTQLGVDTFATDPITHLNLTTNGFEEMLSDFDSTNLPWILLGGGGYELQNVKRAWTLAWAHALSGSFVKSNKDKLNPLRDPKSSEDDLYRVIEADIKYLKDNVLKLIKNS